MPSTIDQVAKQAGVSKATVSRVLNNSKPVKPETRDKVLKAIRALDFKPNPAARSLVYKKSGIIGVVVTDIANLFVSVLVRGIEEIAHSSGYNIFICNSHGSPAKELELLMMLKNKRVDGIIFLTSQLQQEHRDFFITSSQPVALVNVGYEQGDIISICIDNFRAAYDLTAYFIAKGLTKIGMIRAPLEDEYTGRKRFFGYRQALDDHGINYDDNLVATGTLEAEGGYRVALDLCERGVRPQALFVACDLMAFGVIKALREKGLNVPADVEVAGFDDVPMASYYQPALTTIHQPIDEMGRLAAGQLITLIEGREIEQWEIVLPHRLIIRDSTDQKGGGLV